jgi:hypothetical protein
VLSISPQGDNHCREGRRDFREAAGRQQAVVQAGMLQLCPTIRALWASTNQEGSSPTAAAAPSPADTLTWRRRSSAHQGLSCAAVLL